MDEESRDAAGFEPLRPYLDDVQYVSPADGGSLIENRLAKSRVVNAHALSRLGQPVDNTSRSMTPQTVNAYYSSTYNEIVFPAAMLQALRELFEAYDVQEGDGMYVAPADRVGIW